MIIKIIKIDFDDNKVHCSNCIYYQCSYRSDSLKFCSQFKQSKNIKKG
jgi:hypothetical protein